jgi:hypothetical protein
LARLPGTATDCFPMDRPPIVAPEVSEVGDQFTAAGHPNRK